MDGVKQHTLKEMCVTYYICACHMDQLCLECCQRVDTDFTFILPYVVSIYIKIRYVRRCGCSG